MQNQYMRVEFVAVIISTIILASCAALSQKTIPKEKRTVENQEQKQIHDLAEMLPERPEGLGKPISDRAAWKRFGEMEQFRNLVAQAERLVDAPLPEVPDDLYLEFSRTGARNGWQSAAGTRHRRLQPLVLAECIENQGRFIPAIERLVDALCSEKTWVLPAHDKDLVNFHREKITIDLWSSAFAWELATADWLLGDKLPSHTREKIRDNIRWRIIEPYREMTADLSKARGWLGVTHNWNTVCIAGVTGAILEQVESRKERARFLAAAIKFSQSYLKGYGEDGYCSEGLGYWNYGMGHYVLLAQTIQQATNGKIDLMERPLVDEIAKFGLKIQIMNGVYPAFADCPVNAKPDPNLMHFISGRWNMGLDEYSAPIVDGYIFQTLIYSSGYAAAAKKDAAATGVPASTRDWFNNTGILVARPASGSSCRIGVALKGGNNAEHHNHNDLGSYVVVLGKTPVLVDPGSERYTARTFSPQRYESKVLNSFGHPVPMVAGHLQNQGAEARAEILKTDFSENSDSLEMDIRSAYPVEGLKTLTRSFLYSRKGKGALTITDQMECATPQSFGTALITGGSCEQMDDGRLRVRNGEESVIVIIDTAGAPYGVKIEPIDEQTSIKVTRIGIALKNAVSQAKVRIQIEPANDAM